MNRTHVGLQTRSAVTSTGRRQLLKTVGLLGASMSGLHGCATVVSSPTQSSAAIDPTGAWVLLPLANLSETAQAGLRTEALIEVALRHLGLPSLARYPSSLVQDSILEPSERKNIEQAMQWAREQGLRYGVTGSVSEWRYKLGIEGEPAVGLGLQLVDLRSGQTVWNAAGARTGWSREALSAVAQRLVMHLLSPLAPTIRLVQRDSGGGKALPSFSVAESMRR